ncbi:hypothetical protein [Methylorubrum salsuginis]|uniref:Uncharacterized protein n=1 Tax=Methylorubrum salsuginis TaxID=414703 RepID=A0A1I4N1D2_9HYPH|nr:hypothetical protein [Methylorubrum salsuginis]SFM09116.1 hypothetical protein SAMN04488125_1513 [Methylorubrum salsuginis]
MKEDIYVSLLHWISALGHEVTMDCGRFEPHALNILVGLQYLSRTEVAELAASDYDYAVFDVEFIDRGMVNYKPETAWLFDAESRRFFDRCHFFLSYFTESVRMMSDLGVFSRQIVPGYTPILETAGRLSDRDKDIDVYFFGNVDAHRRPLLTQIGKACRLVVNTPADATPLKLRNVRADRSRIVLSLGRARPFHHIGPMRLVAMAHLRAFVLSEPPTLDQPELADLCTYWARDQDPTEAIRFWLEASDLREKRAEAAYERMRGIDPLAPLAAVLDHATEQTRLPANSKPRASCLKLESRVAEAGMA